MDFDFAFFLLIATVVTGVVWGGYLVFLKAQGKVFDEAEEPWLVEYARSFFPIVLIINERALSAKLFARRLYS